MAKLPVHEVAASVFKARCLGLIDEVAESRVPIVVTKRGKPVAKLVPLDEAEPPSLLGSVSYASEEDLLAPVDEVWDAES
jgi:prevent-host-death family protein